MGKIRIKNFGPIQSGYDKGFLDIAKVTVLIGNQATGKSSVAKLYAIFRWLEKALYREEVSLGELEAHSFINKYGAQRGIQNYFKKETEIEYIGQKYHFLYQNEKLKIKTLLPTDDFVKTKIMYVPSERNILAMFRNPRNLKDLPFLSYLFLERYENALSHLGTRNVDLPISGLKFEYRSQTKTPYILGQGYKLHLSEASSGVHSAVPLYLVSRYLCQQIHEKEDPSKVGLSLLEAERINKKIDELILQEKVDEDLLTHKIREIRKNMRSRNKGFVNIVEELEQNLYPDSQKNLLFELLTFAQDSQANELFLTTHSPYIINYLSLAVKAHQVYKQKEATEKLQHLVPHGAALDHEDLRIYELTEDGKIRLLDNYNGIPSDDNLLNHSLAVVNDIYDELLDIEEEE